MRSSLLAMFMSLGLSGAAVAAGSEHVFQDPVTGKSGKYMIDVPPTGARPQGLLLFFHGSGGGPGYAGNFADVASAAAGEGLAAVSLQAPNGNVTWADAARGPSNRHYDYVHSFLTNFFKTYPEISKKRLALVGVSAGSTFLSGDFLPRYGGEYGGGAVMLCGGGAPVGATPMAPLNGMKLFYYIQTGDFLYPQTLTGVGYWQRRGVRAQIETPAGSGHCAFDLMVQMRRGLKLVLD